MENSVQNISQVYIEISGKCMAQCPYCVQSRLKRMKHNSGIMSPILFEKILNQLFKLDLLERTRDTIIHLYNWGEPFLNPEINNILQILQQKNLYASISSNFILRPNVDRKYLSVIRTITFSLSGFSQHTYGRIHGASLEKVLNNFQDFYAMIRKYSPRTTVNIAWHRYTFNEKEFWCAYKYFNMPGIRFNPSIAYLNDNFEMIDYLNGKLSKDRKKQAEKDLFIDHLYKEIVYNKNKSKGYRCPAWDTIVIDETGQLLLCCGVSRYDSDHVLGKILGMSVEEIWKNKLLHPYCNECISSGFPRWAYNQNIGGFRDKSWPSGGWDFLKLWFNHRVLYRPSRLRHLLKMVKKGIVLFSVKRG